MKNIFVLLLFLALSACNDNTDSSKAGSDASKSTKPAVVSPAKTPASKSIDLNSLPQTVTTELSLNPPVEAGDDAFGDINVGGENILVSVTDAVATSAGIDKNKTFSGKVTLTISAEHKVSNELMRVYSISKLVK